MRATTATEWQPRRIARACDDVLDFLVLAFAAWTVIYHVCLVLSVGTLWAAVAAAAALVPCAWLVLRRSEAAPAPPAGADVPAPTSRRIVLVVTVNVVAAVVAAALFAFTSAPWPVVWLLWIVAAGGAVVATSRRPAARIAGDGRKKAPPEASGPAWPATLIALGWAVALATFSLFLVGPDGDDTHYVHLSAWVAANGEFPVRDILFSDQVLPAIIFPPLSSFEALAGTVARGTGLAVPDLVYLVVTPLASALSVLAVWRLLRTWGARMVGVALSVAMVFLLLDAGDHRTLGNLFISRLWQGKIVFLAILLPVLFVLLHEYVARPTKRQLLLLGAAGAAGVGLTTTAVFVVPVVAAGYLAPLALRSWKQAGAGLAAAVAYPLSAGVGTLAVGGRNADVSSRSDVVAGELARQALGDGVPALIAVTAVLVGPVLIRRAAAAAMTAATVLLVGCLYSPPVPLLVFELTDLGRVLWRWMWAVPTAALVGVVAVGMLARIRRPAVRALPLLLLVAALAAWGTPLWSEAAGTTVASKPAWKRPPGRIAAARQILAHARPGDHILAPQPISQVMMIMSGTVTTVAPRRLYTRALRGVPGAHAHARLTLMRFVEYGLRPTGESARPPITSAEVTRALRVVSVDLACLPTGEQAARRLLLAAGYLPAVTVENVSCLQAPGRASPDPESSR